MQTQKWINLSAMVRDIGIGTGAIFGSLSGIKIYKEWRESGSKERYQKKMQKLLSASRLNNHEIKLIKPSSRDEIYAIDDSTKRMWWIRNLSTLHDLGFSGHDAEEIELSKLKEYKNEYTQEAQINFYD